MAAAMIPLIHSLTFRPQNSGRWNAYIPVVLALGLLLAVGSRPASGQVTAKQSARPGQSAPYTPPRQPGYSSQKITLDSKGSLQDALEALFRQSHVNYIYALRGVSVETAHVKIARTSFDDALNTILHTYNAQPPIRPHPTGSVLSLMQIDLMHTPKDGKKQTVTLRLRNARLQDAFRALFAALGTDYTLDNSIQGHVTLSQRDVSYRSVLDALMAQSPRPLTLTDRGNYLIIKIKPQKHAPKRS